MKTIDGEKVYEASDFTEEFDAIVAEAKEKWRAAIEEWERTTGGKPFFAVHSGAGIKIANLPARHRKAKLKLILEPPLSWNNQCAWIESAPAIKEFLRSRGVECLMDYGIDD